MKEKLRKYLLHKLMKRSEQIVIAYGGLNPKGRDLFTIICESAYKQTKNAHPDYPNWTPSQLSSFSKRFLSAYVVQTNRLSKLTK